VVLDSGQLNPFQWRSGKQFFQPGGWRYSHKAEQLNTQPGRGSCIATKRPRRSANQIRICCRNLHLHAHQSTALKAGAMSGESAGASTNHTTKTHITGNIFGNITGALLIVKRAAPLVALSRGVSKEKQLPDFSCLLLSAVLKDLLCFIPVCKRMLQIADWPKQ
jgi:hypothetical protein